MREGRGSDTPLSMHRVAMVPEFTMADMAQMQAEDTELADAYRVIHEGLDPPQMN